MLLRNESKISPLVLVTYINWPKVAVNHDASPFMLPVTLGQCKHACSARAAATVTCITLDGACGGVKGSFQRLTCICMAISPYISMTMCLLRYKSSMTRRALWESKISNWIID